MASSSFIEPLEARIAPATFVNTSLVTYVDVDGDVVKVKSSHPIFHKDLREFTFTPNGLGEELSALRLEASAAGASLAVKVIETSASGNGTASVGFIDAEGVDLRSVAIEGPLGRIVVGDGEPDVRSLDVLHAASLELGGDFERSVFLGGLGVLKIDEDLRGSLVVVGDLGRAFVGGSIVGKPNIEYFPASIEVRGVIGKVKLVGDLVGSTSEASGKIYAEAIGTVAIGGSILGGSGNESGSVMAGAIGSVTVQGNIVGAEGRESGKFHILNGNCKSFWLGGSLIGGSGVASGMIAVRQIEFVKIEGSVVGGDGPNSGAINGTNNIDHAEYDHGRFDRVRINGDVQGGSSYRTGSILGEIGTSLVVGQSVHGGSGGASGSIDLVTVADVVNRVEVRIGLDLIGGSGPGAGKISALASRSILDVMVGGDVREVSRAYDTEDYYERVALTSGSIIAHRLGTVQIGGSITAADRPGLDPHLTSYAVLASTSVEDLQVGGSIVGIATNLVGFSAGAQAESGLNSEGIQSMRVRGSVHYAEVSAGYCPQQLEYGPGPQYNSDARIGTVRINGDLGASSITAGIHPGEDSQFGTADDYAEAGEPTEVKSRIASIIIGGQISGTSTAADTFGIAAQRIISMTIGGVPVPLTSDLDTIQLAPATNDVLLREHA